MSTAHETPRTWDIIAVADGTSGRGDLAAAELQWALDAGWEPFAVATGRIWLKKHAAVEAEANVPLETPPEDRQSLPGTPDVVADPPAPEPPQNAPRAAGGGW